MTDLGRKRIIASSVPRTFNRVWKSFGFGDSDLEEKRLAGMALRLVAG
jgi:hypothetical protein